MAWQIRIQGRASSKDKNAVILKITAKDRTVIRNHPISAANPQKADSSAGMEELAVA
jgi:hypothetical protein